MWIAGLASVWLASACVGSIGGSDAGPGLSDEIAAEVAQSGMRRLSLDEYVRSVDHLLGLEAESARTLLPADTFAPFDNDYTLQTPSEALIKGAELVAGDVAEAVVADPALREAVVGCVPTSAGDAACFQSFVTTFGRRAVHRPLAQDEVARFMGLLDIAVEHDDFYSGVNAALRAFLQHPEFLYRVELGKPVAGHPDLRALTDHEIGARLSYFLLGSTSPDWLLDAADAGELGTESGIKAAAQRLFDDPGARDRLNRFHAMWLSYAQLSDDGISGQMHAETNRLLERIVFDEKRAWTDLLLADETYLSPELAEHYGLPSPGSSAGWVSYEGTTRRGILSHGTFLSAASKFGDTSPTQRGLLIRTRLFCQEIAKPPPNLQVDVDEPPMTADPNACKQDQYFMGNDPQCSACHALMDNIGFGLEAYDATGRFRDTEPDRPDCPISGDGEFLGVGTFNGPAGLADLALESGLVESCVATQLYRFAVGRSELDEHDLALIDRVVAASAEGGLVLDAFVLNYVSSESFRFTRNEVSP
jgi:Protein of unknown function (DUF1592)/Protein of unknown function (DUF1588)/Protein of unknown function (DUF1595)/Protein of unknown function (DUF1585)/Protein of unknown function (DUF1587)